MTRLAVPFLVLLLVACGTSYRDRSVAITSMAVFDPVRYAGLWYEVARFPVPYQEGCENARAEYGVTSPGVLSVRNTCTRSGGVSVIAGRAEMAGPGRMKLRLEGQPKAVDYWVLWVDEGYRTAVVGLPSGRAGWILNRTPDIPPDRLRAAREVLRFNGYDVSQLRMNARELGK